MKAKRRIIVIAAAALVAAVFALALVASSWVDGSHSGAATNSQASLVKPKKLTRSRIMPESQRVDLAVPTFSGPSKVTNQLNGRIYVYNEVNNALDSINRAVRARRARQGSVAALDAAQASLDLHQWTRGRIPGRTT